MNGFDDEYIEKFQYPKLKVTNKKTGKTWMEENRNHSWKDFCLEMLKNHPDMCLVWCDIEGIAKMDDTWYLLDETGRWEYIPEEYSVEEVF
jgi:hypothetical protein